MTYETFEEKAETLIHHFQGVARTAAQIVGGTRSLQREAQQTGRLSVESAREFEQICNQAFVACAEANEYSQIFINGTFD